MMLRPRTILLFLFAPLLLFAQPPDSLWSHTYGSSGDDFCKRIFQTSDNGYMLAGNSNGSLWVLKTDANGDSLWSQSYGDPGESCNAVTPAHDGDITLCSVVFGEESPNYFWLREIAGNGNLQHSYQLSATGGVWYTSLNLAPDRGYILGGATAYGAGLPNAVLTKTNANGDIDWSYSYGGDSTDYFSNVLIAPDGGFVASGYTNSEGAGRMDFWLVKTDSEGQLLWSHTYGTSGIERCWSCKRTNGGGYILAGNQVNEFGNSDFWIITTDENGEELQRRGYGGGESCLSVELVDDGGYIFSGIVTPEESGYSDIWIIRTDSELNQLWTRRLSGGENNNLAQVKQTFDGGFILGGSAFNLETNFDFWLLKLDTDHVSEASNPSGSLPNETRLAQNYPNPFNPNTEIQFDLSQTRETSVKVFDITGREVATLANEIMTAGSHKINFDGSNLASGIYIYQLSVAPPSVPPAEARGMQTQSKKMVLIK